MKSGQVVIDTNSVRAVAGTVSIGLGADARLDVNVHRVKGDTHRLVVTQYLAGAWAQLAVREFDRALPTQGGSDYEALKAADELAAAVEHIAVHGEHDQECNRPPQDCAADALATYRKARHGQQ